MVQDLFTSPESTWISPTDVLRAHKCLVSLAKTWPDKFESLYSHGNLNKFIEGSYWLAANGVLSLRWHMKAPVVAKAGIFKGP